MPELSSIDQAIAGAAAAAVQPATADAEALRAALQHNWRKVASTDNLLVGRRALRCNQCERCAVQLAVQPPAAFI
jgi:hypothetical protein